MDNWRANACEFIRIHARRIWKYAYPINIIRIFPEAVVAGFVADVEGNEHDGGEADGEAHADGVGHGLGANRRRSGRVFSDSCNSANRPKGTTLRMPRYARA